MHLNQRGLSRSSGTVKPPWLNERCTVNTLEEGGENAPDLWENPGRENGWWVGKYDGKGESMPVSRGGDGVHTGVTHDGIQH